MESLMKGLGDSWNEGVENKTTSLAAFGKDPGGMTGDRKRIQIT